MIIYGIIVSLISSVRFVPQVIKTFGKKKVDDISECGTWWIFLTGVAWLIYNIYSLLNYGLVELPYFLNNFVQVMTTLVLLVMYYRYSKGAK